MTEYRYKLTEASLQCGEKPPYRLLNMPVRVNGGVPQVKWGNRWFDCPKDGPRPDIKKAYGMPVAGIATTWELDHDPPT